MDCHHVSRTRYVGVGRFRQRSNDDVAAVRKFRSGLDGVVRVYRPRRELHRVRSGLRQALAGEEATRRARLQWARRARDGSASNGVQVISGLGAHRHTCT